jgi:hypothetical protein
MGGGEGNIEEKVNTGIFVFLKKKLFWAFPFRSALRQAPLRFGIFCPAVEEPPGSENTAFLHSVSEGTLCPAV